MLLSLLVFIRSSHSWYRELSSCMRMIFAARTLSFYVLSSSKVTNIGFSWSRRPKRRLGVQCQGFLPPSDSRSDPWTGTFHGLSALLLDVHHSTTRHILLKLVCAAKSETRPYRPMVLSRKHERNKLSARATTLISLICSLQTALTNAEVLPIERFCRRCRSRLIRKQCFGNIDGGRQTPQTL